MEDQLQKVYVAIGNDVEDGLGTLEWVLRKWPPSSLSIIILYAENNMGKDAHINVLTPVGKLPRSFLNDEKLNELKMSDKVKIDKTLSKYIDYCGKVKIQILHIDKYDEPLQNIIVKLISRLQISKLVMGFTFMKSSTWKSRNVINGPFYIYREKPDYCEFFVIYGAKLVFLREENNEGFVEDDQGILVAKVGKRYSYKGWLGKIFQDSSGTEKSPPCSPPSLTYVETPNQWQKFAAEIETYFNQLLSSNEDEQGGMAVAENSIVYNSIKEQDIAVRGPEKVEVLKMKIERARDANRLQTREAKASIERQRKAEWAISSCIQQAKELEARVSREAADIVEKMKDLDTTNDEIKKIRTEVEERRRKLNSIVELQLELANKLTSSSLSKSRAELILESTMRKREDVVQEIEVLHKQIDVIHRRIEYCKDKNATGITTTGLNYKEFTSEEIRVATDDFSENFRLKSACDCTNVYKGRITTTTVAIKCMFHLSMDEEAFQTKVKLLGQVHHPNIVAVLGFCSQLRCIVFEYMHNGCLRDTLFSSCTNSRKRNRGLNWYARIRLLTEVCSALAFLHQARPGPIVHGNLNPSKVLLDHNNVAKIHGLTLGYRIDESNTKPDIRAFGNLILQLITGRNWGGLVDEAAIVMDQVALVGVLDGMAGEWPLDLAMELGRIAIRCLSADNEEFEAGIIMGELNEVRKMAETIVGNRGEYNIGTMDESSTVPSAFLCPIYQILKGAATYLQDIMKQPHLAADGFSYELEAIREWLRTGHDTSPMTNLQLKHKNLTPNHTLHSLIEDWHSKTSYPLV